MDFAKKILNKYGWKEGDGLGKDGQGMAKPVKASLKFNNDGLGLDAAAEFNNHWWERVYDEAANNIELQKEASGAVKMKLKNDVESVEITTNSYSIKKMKAEQKAEKKLYEKNFISANNKAESIERDIVNRNKVLTDEDLLKACGGRTAHKGARHGLKLNGKLSRIEKQEQELLEKMLQRNKKEKSSDVADSTSKESAPLPAIVENPKKSKKHRSDSPEQSVDLESKRKKRRTDNEDKVTNVERKLNDFVENDVEKPIKSKKKKKKKKN